MRFQYRKPPSTQEAKQRAKREAAKKGEIKTSDDSQQDPTIDNQINYEDLMENPDLEDTLTNMESTFDNLDFDDIFDQDDIMDFYSDFDLGEDEDLDKPKQ